LKRRPNMEGLFRNRLLTVEVQQKRPVYMKIDP